MNSANAKRIIIALTMLFCIISCSSTNEGKKDTLASIDITDESSLQSDVYVKPKTADEIREAYSNYIQNSSKGDKSRLAAISRLAELELELSNKLIKDSNNSDTDNDTKDDAQYQTTLTKTISLLATSLHDYPDAQGNDKLYYQLAKAYEQNGERSNSIDTLMTLLSKYPKSPYYAEAQFRLAENAFINGDYIGAEDAYTEVIVSPRNDIFYEKSLFKRGWSRYKQQLYYEAIEDFFEAVDYHEFGYRHELNSTEGELFDEYFRAIGLAFSYLGGTEPMREYFTHKSDFKYLYETYATISNIYLKQNRYSDAVDALTQFIQSNPKSDQVPLSQLKIIEIWQVSGFTNKLYDAIEDFYVNYNPSSKFWKRANADPNTAKAVEISLRKYVVLVSGYFHNQFQDSSKAGDFNSAQLWYDRYLSHYSSYARQDNIFYLYAELLNLASRYEDAVYYFEKAAYDGDIVLDKESAYATITLTDKLYALNSNPSNNTWLNKHINYTVLFSELYPNDKKTEDIIVHAAEMAFSSKLYSEVIRLAELLPINSSEKSIYNINIILGQSYINAGRYVDAEVVYSDLIVSQKSRRITKVKLQDQLALAVYKQGESAKRDGNISLANNNFVRISNIAPKSEIAATGLYDAIALSISNELWTEAITYIDQFQTQFPKHRLSNDVSKKLSVAYLRSNQNLKAAKELERIAIQDDDSQVKKAALWQAAELYEKKQNLDSAIRSYRDYANTYPDPFPQHMESMYKLTLLYDRVGDQDKSYFWRNKIRSADRQALKAKQTDRTKYITSVAILGLAKEKQKVYMRISLVEPLQANLRKKKKSMQDAVILYGQASTYGLADITTEATHSIALIYRDFSSALLNSERPKSLNEEELEQYEILLEDQAYPFEEKAIEFFETNIARVRNGTHNDWIDSSYANLKELFPVRYERKGKIEAAISDI